MRARRRPGASWKARRARHKEEAARLVAAYRAALNALTKAEGVEKVQTEVGRWWGVRSGGGLVKFEQPKRGKR
jgi:hypothetical protein